MSVDQEKLLEDIRSSAKKVSKQSQLTPEIYSFLGNYSFEEILDAFGTWQAAIDAAGISLQQRIIRDIQEKASEVEEYLSQRDYRKVGGFSLKDIEEQFGSWSEARAAAGLPDVREHQRISEDELIADLKAAAKSTEGYLSKEKYLENGDFSSHPINRIFDSWHDAKEAAGLKIRTHRVSIPEEKLKKDLRHVNSLVFGLLTQEEYAELGDYSDKTIVYRFETWKNAVQEANLPNQKENIQEKWSIEENVQKREFLTETLYSRGISHEESVNRSLKLWGKAKRLRGSDTDEFLCACLYRALQENGIPVRSQELIVAARLDRSTFASYSRKVKEFSEVSHGILSPTPYLQRLISVLDFENSNEIRKRAEELCSSQSTSTAPASTAAAAIYLAAKEVDEKVSQREVADALALGEVTLRNAKDELLGQ